MGLWYQDTHYLEDLPAVGAGRAARLENNLSERGCTILMLGRNRQTPLTFILLIAVVCTVPWTSSQIPGQADYIPPACAPRVSMASYCEQFYRMQTS